MKRQAIFTALGVFVAYAALSLLEKNVGVYGLALALCYALLVARVHPAIAIVGYAAVNGAVHLSLWYLIVVAAGVVPCVFYVIYCAKTNRKYKVWVNALLILVAQTPCFFLFCHSLREYVLTAVSPGIALIGHFAFLATAYPILVRGVRYEATERERAFFAVSAAAVGAGLATFSPWKIEVACFAIAAFCVTYERAAGKSALSIAAGAGLGAAAATGDAFYVAAAVAVCLGAAARRLRAYAGGAGAFFLYAGCAYLFGRGLTWQVLAPVGAAAVFGFLPEKIFAGARARRESYRGKFALRTAANREREEVSGKLDDVAEAMRTAYGILEGEKKKRLTARDVADGVRERCCRECGKFAACREKIGDARKAFLKAATNGMETGRVTYLDFDGSFTSVCARVPRVIHVTAEYVRMAREEAEKRTGAEQGREMVLRTLSGTADLLGELSSSVKRGFGFDVEGEKRIREELACADVVAGDAAIYQGGDKITLTVREGDERKGVITGIVSEAAGQAMYAAERRDGVNGTVNLTYRPNPRFGVLYGVKSEAKEGVCGDATEAVRVADDKVLFVLSDGMGTGKEAHRVGADAIRLIETFYKAGFAHSTTFGWVSGLLALREKEDFSALDVAILDTHIGEINFVKQGGRESYFFSSEGVEKIESGSLPMGIVEECEPTFWRKRVKGNELAVMMSDGVADSLTQADVTEIVGNLRTLNPQVIADKIVENAIKKSGSHKDDVTAMVFRIVRNNA